MGWQKGGWYEKNLTTLQKNHKKTHKKVKFWPLNPITSDPVEKHN